MKQTEVLTALNLPVTMQFKAYANKIAAMLKLVQELEKMEGFTVLLSGIKGNLEMVKALPVFEEPENYSKRYLHDEKVKQQNNCKDIFGEFQQWDEITVSFKGGCYKFPLPVGNSIYNVFSGMAGNEVQETQKEITILETITVDSSILKSIGKAVKFISKDGLRPAMQHVCLTFFNDTCEVVATDAHKLYYSSKLKANKADKMQVLITEAAAKTIAKMKAKKDAIDIHILEGEKVMIEGNVFAICTEHRYPDYPCVIPKYETYMTFEKDKFVSNVKKVIPYANKSTSQVKFHLNGSIALHTEDVDFSFECDADMPYITKDFPDTDIAFNGKFLIETMGIFKDDTVKMYTAGVNTQGAIFTNNIDSVLIMPLMLNPY